MSLKKIVFILVGFVLLAAGAVVGLASQKPDDFEVSRSLSIDASQKEIFSYVNDLHKWDAWSPWAKIDPEASSTFEGPDVGVGSSMAWDGKNFEVGSGKMTITESKPYTYIKIDLQFPKPFAGNSSSDFTFEPKDGETLVTWKMFGHSDLIGKVMSLFFDCETMIGEKYDEGLASLKAVVETS